MDLHGMVDHETGVEELELERQLFVAPPRAV